MSAAPHEIGRSGKAGPGAGENIGISERPTGWRSARAHQILRWRSVTRRGDPREGEGRRPEGDAIALEATLVRVALRAVRIGSSARVDSGIDRFRARAGKRADHFHESAFGGNERDRLHQQDEADQESGQTNKHAEAPTSRPPPPHADMATLAQHALAIIHLQAAF
ncbi:hypothetical protein [Methylosinus sp. LW4]|uniref:hypothetical protein n=1 Tax=Methylosinus sp. LW4 TaxID=136993 RepID=UPI0012FA1052|nr:hypothetical protein [Methylosinus sp. LW4]